MVEGLCYSSWRNESLFLPEVAVVSAEINFKLCPTSVLFFGDVTVSVAFPFLANCVLWRGFYSRKLNFAAPKEINNAECLSSLRGPNISAVPCKCIRARWTNYISPRLARGT